MSKQNQDEQTRDTHAQSLRPTASAAGLPVFLFTDIEGSTSLWETHPAEMLPALLNHNRILEEQIARHGGRILELRGDGVKAVFEGVNPLPCVLAIQRQFDQLDWGVIGELRVRIGLHGVPVDGEGRAFFVQGEQYFGPALHHAARIMDAGWGGQILVSEWVRNAFPLPPGASWQDFGPHELKGVEKSQSIFGLLHPDLPLQELRPLRTLTPPEESELSQSRRHNLPHQTTPFVGRIDALAQISSRLNDPACRLLSLVGPGGAGKTRLAIQAAQETAESELEEIPFADGIFFVSLAPLNSPDLLVPSIADAVGFTCYSDRDTQAQLLDYLREKDMLLVLDNFEHLLPSPTLEENPAHSPPSEATPEGGRDLVADILTNAPGVKILVTSRQALDLRQEWFHPVAGMRFPEWEMVKKEDPEADLRAYSAVRFFTQCALRVRPNFSFADERACVLRICRLVDGMPLGIELATAWLKALTCEQIAEEIERSLDFLTTSMRDVPARHRSMRAVLEHSWELLSDAERDVLRGLSVFRGGFRPGAAQQVAGASLPVLASLVEKSLVRLTPAGRYGMHQLLRQFAAGKLGKSPAEEQATQTRHANHYLAFVQQREGLLKGGQQPKILTEIREELDNVRVGWNWAIEQGQLDQIDQSLEGLYEFYRVRSRFQEGEEAFRQAAQRLQKPTLDESKGHSVVWAKLLARQGAFCYLLGRYGAAAKWLKQSLALSRQLDAQAEIAFALSLLGDVVRRQGADAEAKQLYGESLTINTERGDLLGVAYALNRLGWVAEYQGEFREAKKHFQESLALYQELKHKQGIAHSLDKLAAVAFSLGEYVAAERHYEESLTIFRALEDRFGTARALGGLGFVAFAMGGARLTEARPLLKQSLALCREIGHRLEIAIRLNMLGMVANGLGEYEQAQHHHEEALRFFTELDAPEVGALARNGLAEAACGLGDLTTARQYLLEAFQTDMVTCRPYHLLEILRVWAAVLAKEGDLIAQEEIPTAGRALAGSTPAADGAPFKEAVFSDVTHIEQAVEILSLVLHHPAGWQFSRDRAAALLADLDFELTPRVAAARERWKTRLLEEVVAEIVEQNEPAL